VYRVTGMDGELGARRRFAQRQAELLSSGRFDVTSVEDYIDRYRDRFWLTGPPAGLPPFAQDPTLAALEMQPVAKLVATWASGNNPALGPHSPVAEIDNASAARWLLIAHGYSAGGIYTGRVADQPGRHRAVLLSATGQNPLAIDTRRRPCTCGDEPDRHDGTGGTPECSPHLRG